LGMSNVLLETDNSGTAQNYYVYGLGLVSRIKPSNITHYYVYDYRGSTVAMVDATTNATVTHKYQYDDFGKVLQLQEADYNPFRYVGKFGVMYEDSTLQFMRARYYDPTIGRFLTSWPMTPLTGQLALIFLVFAWMALVRLGKPKSANLDLPLGKEAMIQNAAELMAFGGHSGHMISRYVRANVFDLCAKLHAPAADFDLQVKWLQDRIDARGIQTDLANIVDRAETLAFARGPTLDRQILSLAKETYILRQELLHE